jgi:hypothetical protein
MQQLLTNFQASPEIYAGVILIIIEFIIRLKPTEKNLSILDAIHRVINLVLPNIKKEKTANRVSGANEKIEAFKSKFSIK